MQQTTSLAVAPLRRQVAAPQRISLEMNRADRRSAVYPPHREEGASTCASRKRNHCVAPVSKDGAAIDLGFTRDRHQMCASRVYPTCDVRDAAHKTAEFG